MSEALAMQVEQEEWRPVVGYEGLYSVSSMGRIRREGGTNGAVSGRILKPFVSIGYAACSLSKNGQSKHVRYAGVVAEAFIGPRPSGMEINHKNGVRTDNRPENLEYVSHSENMRHAKQDLRRFVSTADIRYRRDNPETKKGRREQIRLFIETGRFTLTEIASMMKMELTSLSRMVKNNGWRHLVLRKNETGN